MIFKSEFPDVPIVTESFPKFFLNKIWQHYIKDPHKKALINAKDELDNVTFGELYLISYSVASFLKKKNFGHSDTCCIVLTNGWQFVTIFIGTAIQGGITSLGSNSFTEYELQQQFQNSNSKIIFCSILNFEKTIKAAANIQKIELVVVVGNNIELQSHPFYNKKYSFEIVSFTTVIQTSPNFILQKEVIFNTKKDVLLLPYSSGTTGSPKGVMISHQNFGTMMAILTNHLRKNVYDYFDKKYDEKENIEILLLPFYHIFGIALVISNLLKGSTNVFLQNFEPYLFCSTIQKYQPRILMLVPPILLFLAKNSIVSQYDLSSVNFVLSGAAPAGRDLCIELQKKHPNIQHVTQGYGMTELSLGSILPVIKDKKNRYDSSGKLLSNFELKIIDVDSGKELGYNKPGELCFKSPTVMIGYLNNLTATNNTIDKDGFLHSGDIGYIDNEGYIYIIDRLKELIKVKGYQVPPAELEDILLTHPKILDCAVIGVLDEKDDELPKAFVVKSDDSLKEEEVVEFVKSRVAHYKQLKGGVEFINEIPKSQAGKILRKNLREKSRKQPSKI